jgi:metal-responsive CopG/Arc/MetJ family transcriptional regulator
MTLTVRLDPDLEKRFNHLVREQGRTKSEVVIELLTRYVESRESKSAYEVALEVGVFDLPATESPRYTARNHKKHLAAALTAKHRR